MASPMTAGCLRTAGSREIRPWGDMRLSCPRCRQHVLTQRRWLDSGLAAQDESVADRHSSPPPVPTRIPLGGGRPGSNGACPRTTGRFGLRQSRGSCAEFLRSDILLSRLLRGRGVARRFRLDALREGATPSDPSGPAANRSRTCELVENRRDPSKGRDPNMPLYLGYLSYGASQS
jgi:hypothetical protein